MRRRIGYIQKRGFNERNNYSYVTAADLAGAVGDILAELGVVIIPSLESIAYESGRGNGAELARSAQVVMAYTFTDVDTGEAITTKVAGQGLDAGDKARYKAMTGALKYALLQSFLLATGDDPEDERINHSSGNGPERLITPEEARQVRVLVDQTETELDRVLSYYKIYSLEEMRESSYRRAVELLNRKRTKQTHEETAMPKIERLEQNTPEWRSWRMEGIGSSDAPVIMSEGAAFDNAAWPKVGRFTVSKSLAPHNPILRSGGRPVIGVEEARRRK